jgi:hypothetical protein
MLAAGIAVAAIFFALRATGVLAGVPQPWRLFIATVISGYFGMTWIFALTGYARAMLHRESPGLRYATEAVYPFYIVHQTITIAAAYYVVQWSAGIPVKLAAVVAATFFGSWAVVEVIRRVTPLRPLFGLKLRPTS